MSYLSVMVRSYNNASTIEKCLTAIKESVYRDYELIVIDDGSFDETLSIIKNYTDKLIGMPQNLGRSYALKNGIKASNGEIIINVDSDVVIRPDTLSIINDYFLAHPSIDALTGVLAKEHPNPDFFSQYKNLYMHYIFKKLPERVTFLYGSIFAVRCRAAQQYSSNIALMEDAAFGQYLISCGSAIAFLRDLEVTHLKKYSLIQFIKNDFQVPFYWVKVFFKFKGWKQLGRNKTGFIHSPKWQLMSVILAPVIILLLPEAILRHSYVALVLSVATWLLLNYRFFGFLTREKGLFFGMTAVFVCFLDNIIMALGIFCGFFYELKMKIWPSKSESERIGIE